MAAEILPLSQPQCKQKVELLTGCHLFDRLRRSAIFRGELPFFGPKRTSIKRFIDLMHRMIRQWVQAFLLVAVLARTAASLARLP